MAAKKKRGTPNYCSYIHKVLKKVHPELSIQQKAIVATNALVESLIDRVTQQSAHIAIAAKKNTMQARHVQAATKMLMPEMLSAHAVSEGTKAVTLFAK